MNELNALRTPDGQLCWNHQPLPIGLRVNMHGYSGRITGFRRWVGAVQYWIACDDGSTMISYGPDRYVLRERKR
jgi:hypothetical protein